MRAASRLLSAMDRSVESCDDLFEYSCGAWNIIRDDKSSYNTFRKLADQLHATLKRTRARLSSFTTEYCHVFEIFGYTFLLIGDSDYDEKNIVKNSLKHLVRTTVAKSHNKNSKYEKDAIT